MECGGCVKDHRRLQNLKILDHYLSEETSRICKKDFFDNQSEITNDERVFQFINMIKLNTMDLHETMSLAFQFVDRYLTITDVKLEDFGTICAAAFEIAEISSTNYPKVFSEVAGNTIRKTAFHMVQKLGFRIADPTIYHFLHLILELGCSGKLHELSNDVVTVLKYNNFSKINVLFMISVMSTEFSCLPPSLQLAGILKCLNVWNEELAIQLRKSTKQVDECCGVIAREIGQRSINSWSLFYDEYDFITTEYSGMGNEELLNIISQTVKEEKPLKIISKEDFRQKFFKKSLLGTGMWASVYLTEDLSLDMDVALKIMKIVPYMSKWTEGDILDTLISDMMGFVYLKGLNGIVKTIDAFYVEESSTFVQEIKLYEGTLENLLSKRPSKEIIKKVLRTSLEGIANLNERGFRHRDIHGANILIDDDKEGCVSDMGMLKRYFEQIKTDDIKELAALFYTIGLDDETNIFIEKLIHAQTARQMLSDPYFD